MIYVLCRNGLLGHLRIGRGRGTIRIEQADIDAYKKRARVEATGPKPRHSLPSDHGYVYKHIKPQA
ncbi:hypothetical protein [Singulisphaera sp. PoT]|uniref:hypothetical protein n=1 Tax=Singulisphaera sp. PoT TaxID=3411797 RepID=UPI003BF51761